MTSAVFLSPEKIIGSGLVTYNITSAGREGDDFNQDENSLCNDGFFMLFGL
jgi:hypothetical protein